jgi:hypothetical protein
MHSGDRQLSTTRPRPAAARVERSPGVELTYVPPDERTVGQVCTVRGAGPASHKAFERVGVVLF